MGPRLLVRLQSLRAPTRPAGLLSLEKVATKPWQGRAHYGGIDIEVVPDTKDGSE